MTIKAFFGLKFPRLKLTASKHGYDKLAEEIQTFLQDKIRTSDGKSQDNQMLMYINHSIQNKYYNWRINSRKNKLNKIIHELENMVKEVKKVNDTLNQQNIKQKSFKDLT